MGGIVDVVNELQLGRFAKFPKVLCSIKQDSTHAQLNLYLEIFFFGGGGGFNKEFITTLFGVVLKGEVQ